MASQPTPSQESVRLPPARPIQPPRAPLPFPADIMPPRRRRVLDGLRAPKGAD